MRKALAITVAIIMSLSSFSIATAAPVEGLPLGASNELVTVETGVNPGTYLVHKGWNNAQPYGSGSSGNHRLIDSQYSWDPETMENYVFDPDLFPGLEYHADGFPMTGTYRTVVQHLGEMRYLHQQYPDITNLVLAGYTVGAPPGGANEFRGLGTNTSTTTGTNFNNLGTFTEGPVVVTEADLEVEAARAPYKIPVYALEISSNPGVMDGRPAHLHQAGNHAGELDANEMTMNLCWYLLTNYGTNPEITNLIDTTRLYMMPYTNADGNMISMRSVNGSRRTNAHGVDLNRNWAYRWGSNNGSASSPGTGGNYRGVSPNSEPETTAISGLYRGDNIISSVSGHTSGQLIIFAWAFLRNPDDAHPMLRELARDQARINGHTPQNGNVMYAQSGEINDYLWGSMRALGFTYEYGNWQTGPYLGNQNGNTYVTLDYIAANGIQKNFKVNYGSGTAPTEDITAPLVWMSDEAFDLGYQNVAPNGPMFRPVTLEKVQAEIDNGMDVKGKIFFSHLPVTVSVIQSPTAPRGTLSTNPAATAQIAALLKEEGALGWAVSNLASNGGYSEMTPAVTGAGYPAGFPIFSVLKGYADDVFTNVKKDPTIKLTMHADLKDYTSVMYQWSRQRDAYMLNMSYPVKYANHLKGTITDASGALVPVARLEASLEIEGKIVALNSNLSDSEVTNMRSDEAQWSEMHTPYYDVVGGVFDWSMLPSKQSEYPDKGWDVTAVANGMYSDSKKIFFPVDNQLAVANGLDPVIFADPLYQQTITGTTFKITKAVTSDFDFEKGYNPMTDVKVPFTTYLPNGNAGAAGTATATVDGIPVTVNDLGGGKFEAVFNAYALGIGGADSAEVALSFDGGVDHSAYTANVKLDNLTAYIDVAPESHIKDKVVFDLSLENAVNVLSVEITYEVDDLLASEGVDSFGGFDVIKSAGWTKTDDGKWSNTTWLGFPAGDTDGFTASNKTKIAQFVFDAKDYGEAVFNVTDIKAVGLNTTSETVLALAVVLVNNGSTVVYNKYDLNVDGSVDLVDLGVMLLYVGYEDTDADWDNAAKAKAKNSKGYGITAKRCDVNFDGIVDILDLTELIANFD